MIKNIVLEGVVFYDNDYDLWCVDEDFIENTISGFEGKNVVVTITVI